MPLDLDAILGSLYLSVEAFKARAGVFGVAVALPADDELIKAALAAASRLIEAECGRDFVPDELTETHRFNLLTRRISVNQPPVATLTSFTLVGGPGLSSPVSLSSVYVNNQENYLEVDGLSHAIAPTGSLFMHGLGETQVEVKYKSYQSVPQGVAAACGYGAAEIINRTYASGQLPGDLTRVEMDGLKVSRAAPGGRGEESALPVVAKALLHRYRRIAVG